MIINNDNFAETLSTGVENSTDMEIDETDKGILQMILSEGLYSDPMGSLIREYTSNALDANREAGNTEPIIVSLKEDANKKWWFKVQDFGVGISPERKEKIISKYAASTKRGSADQLGYFGLGMKSGLAYTDSFNIETVYDGIKYLYVMYKGEKNTKIDLLASFETEEPNGTTISIALKDSAKIHSWDSYSPEVAEFRTRIAEQLAYFEGVYFDIEDFNNDFKIIKSEKWKYSEMTNATHMHLCLDDVYYPIDWEKLGIEAIKFPVALAFKVTDGLVPTPNREQLRMTPTMKNLILDRIKEVSTEFVIKYNETVEEKDNLKDIWNEIGKEDKFFSITPNKQLNIKALKKYSSTPIAELSLKGIKLINFKALKDNSYSIAKKYKVSGLIYADRYTSIVDSDEHKIFTDLLFGANKYYLIGTKPSNIIIDYLKSKGDKTYFLSNSGFHRRLGNYRTKSTWRSDAYPSDGYYTLLELKKYPKNQWRDVIKEYQILEAQIFSNLKDINVVVPSQEFLAERKAARSYGTKTIVSKEEIYPKEVYLLNRAGSTFSFMGAEKIEIGNIRKRPYTFVYFTAEEKSELNGLIPSFYSLKNKNTQLRVKFFQVSTRDFNKLEKHTIHNCISIKKFMEGKTRIFSQFITAYKVYKLLKGNKIIDKFLGTIRKLNIPLYNDIMLLEKYKDEHLFSIYRIDTDFATSCLAMAEENKLWDLNIIGIHNRVVKEIKNYSFIELINNSYGELKSEAFNLVVEVLKNRKIKLNYELYLKSSVEPNKESDEDEITEMSYPDDVLDDTKPEGGMFVDEDINEEALGLEDTDTLEAQLAEEDLAKELALSEKEYEEVAQLLNQD